MPLIKQEALFAEINKWLESVMYKDWVQSAIVSAPTIDAAPVVHGRWEEVDWVEPDGHGFGTVRTPKAGLRCNQCANVFKRELLWKDSFCPNCGARMDGGKGHETG